MKLDCLLIYTPKLNHYYKPFGYHMYGMFMPMGIFALADCINKIGFSVGILHLGIEKIKDRMFSLREYILKTDPKIIGLSLHWHFQSYDVMEIIKEIKLIKPEIFVVLGGFTASYFYEEIMREFDVVDAIIRGDGEIPFRVLVEAKLAHKDKLSCVPNLSWRDGGKVINNEIKYIAEKEDLDRLNFTNLRLLRNYKEYIKYAKLTWFWMPNLPKSINLLLLDKRNLFPLSVSRGCGVNCSYCGGSKISQEVINKRTKVAIRSIDKVVESIQEIKEYGYDTIYICSCFEDTQSSYFSALFNEIRKKKIQINCIMECSDLPNKDFVRKFKEAFPDYSKSQIYISPEAADELIRKLNKGCCYGNNNLFKYLKYINDMKVSFEIFFALGLPFETRETLNTTEEFKKELRFKFGKNLVFRTDLLELEPASPMQIYPKDYNISISRNTFKDFYLAHSIKGNLSVVKAGYHSKNFIGKSIFDRMMCKKNCRISNNLSIKLNKIGIKASGELTILFGNLCCNFAVFFWKINRIIKYLDLTSKDKNVFCRH